MIINVEIEPNWNGHYRLTYDGKYISLYGQDREYKGFKFDESDPDWYEEMVLVPVVAEVRHANPKIVHIDRDFIQIETQGQ
jgi:hypothetical protein